MSFVSSFNVYTEPLGAKYRIAAGNEQSRAMLSGSPVPVAGDKLHASSWSLELMKKWLSIGLAILLILAGGYIAWPRYSLGQLESAARDEDLEALRKYVDFPLLRDKLQSRLQRRVRESMAEDLPAEWGDLFAAGTNLFMAPLLRQLVTPEGVAGLLRGGRDLRALERELYRQPTAPVGEAEAGRDADRDGPGDWKLQGWRLVALDRASADYGGDGRRELRLILERQGLRWRLVDIALLETRET